IDWDETHNMHKATLALSEARAGRNFAERGEIAGTNGIGASGVNFCSQYFRVIVHQNGKKFEQEFLECDAFEDELRIGKPKIREIKTDKTGTRIEWKLSSQVFNDFTLPEQFIK